jgi:hypothetical protein
LNIFKSNTLPPYNPLKVEYTGIELLFKNIGYTKSIDDDTQLSYMDDNLDSLIFYKNAHEYIILETFTVEEYCTINKQLIDLGWIEYDVSQEDHLDYRNDKNHVIDPLKYKTSKLFKKLGYTIAENTENVLVYECWDDGHRRVEFDKVNRTIRFNGTLKYNITMGLHYIIGLQMLELNWNIGVYGKS